MLKKQQQTKENKTNKRTGRGNHADFAVLKTNMIHFKDKEIMIKVNQVLICVMLKVNEENKS